MIKKLIYPSAVCILCCMLIYGYSAQKGLSDNLLRLHIVSNSNSEFDKEIKLMVRDAIIKEAGNKFSHAESKKECRRLLLSESEEIEKTAQRILDENNTGYTAKVSLEKLYIPRKTYDGIILPEGSYEGFMVRLGKSEGENWWCVVYPPLCFTEEVCGELSDEAKEYLRQTLPAESYNLITGDGISIKYKFKIVELLQKAEKNFSKK